MDIKEYIHPEFYILIPVIYLIGMLIKKSNINNRFIPIALGAFSVAAALIYELSLCVPGSLKELFGIIFVSITQGTLCAAASVYANNIYKQMIESNDDEGGIDKINKEDC